MNQQHFVYNPERTDNQPKYVKNMCVGVSWVCRVCKISAVISYVNVTNISKQPALVVSYH